MEGLLKTSTLKGDLAQNAITSAASNVEVEQISKPANSNLTAISNAVSCCSKQESSVNDFKTNLTADAQNIGNLASQFAELDEEQKKKNLSLLGGGGK